MTFAIAPSDPQSRSKKTKTPVKSVRRSEPSNNASSPSQGGLAEESGSQDGIALGKLVLPIGVGLFRLIVDSETINTLQGALNHLGKVDEWPKQFGKRLDKDQAEVLEQLSAAREMV